MVDPARDAASVLRRIGFLALMIGLPVAGLAGRSGAVFVATIGIALVAGAAVFDGGGRSWREAGSRLGRSPSVLVVLVLAGWSLLSLAWTPAPVAAATTWVAAIAIASLGLVGYLALPERMRSANLYPSPIGAAIGAVALIVFMLVWGSDYADAGQRLGRCVAVLVLATWPAVAWLRSRGRDIEALTLAAAVAVTASIAPSAVPVIALAAGALAYLAAQYFDRVGAIAIGFGLACLVALAPLLLVWSGPILAVLPDGAASAMGTWRAAVRSEPVRWVTGHGLGALASAGWSYGLPSGFGRPILLLWYELGLVGALAAAAAIPTAIARSAASLGPLLPALAGAFTSAFVITAAGVERGAWWPVSIVATALIFVAAARGQFRTRRPRLLRLGRPRAA